jgi:signal transduction histidine kinase
LLVSDRLIGTLTFATRNRDTFNAAELELMATVSQYVAVALDRAITDAALRKAQHELSDHAQELETKVRERTAKLQDTIVQLESFSYTVAHDLRAPIRALKSYAQLLLEETTADFPENGRLYLSRIERAANRLDAITRDLLQFSTISRQDVQLTTVDVAELIQDIQLLRPPLQDDVLVVERPLHSVRAHRTLLQHCLSNLLDNAVKFVQPGTKPRVVIRSELVNGKMSSPYRPPSTFNLAGVPQPLVAADLPVLESEPHVRIWVEDNGIGIAPESYEKIFGIFERLNAPDKYEGTGIGLAIVARAMQRMGGACGVESGTSHGSSFWLELTAAKE